MINILWAEMVMGRNGHGPKWLWAEMTRNLYGSRRPHSKGLSVRDIIT